MDRIKVIYLDFITSARVGIDVRLPSSWVGLDVMVDDKRVRSAPGKLRSGMIMVVNINKTSLCVGGNTRSQRRFDES